MIRRIYIVFILTLSATLLFAQNKKAQKISTKKECYHYHCDNPNAIVPNCETIHQKQNKRVKDYSKLSGKLSFKLNGKEYKCIESSVNCYVDVAGCCLSIRISGKTDEYSMINLSYRVPKNSGPVGNNIPATNFVNLERFTFNDSTTSYSNYFTFTDSPTKMRVNVICAYKYARYNYLLNGNFSGELKDEEGNIVKITDGIFCSNQLKEDELKD
jgi:hypothetical protein